MSDKFEYMNDVVDEICKSLYTEPQRWIFDTHTFHKKGTNISYWLGLSPCITETRDTHTNHVVFSSDQGYKIWAAYQHARLAVASTAQEKILSTFATRKEASKENVITAEAIGYRADSDAQQTVSFLQKLKNTFKRIKFE